jgi:hypothetical protein
VVAAPAETSPKKGFVGEEDSAPDYGISSVAGGLTSACGAKSPGSLGSNACHRLVSGDPTTPHFVFT